LRIIKQVMMMVLEHLLLELLVLLF